MGQAREWGKIVIKVNKWVYIASRTHQLCWQYAIILVWTTWLRALNQLNVKLLNLKSSTRLCLQMLVFCIFGVFFSKKLTFKWKRTTLQKKKCDSQGITIWYWYRWYCGNPKIFVDGTELTRNINKKKKQCVLQAYRCPLCDKCSRQE